VRQRSRTHPGRPFGLDVCASWQVPRIRAVPQEQVLIKRDDVRVMFRRVTDEQGAITRAWTEVEEAVGSLRARKFYGAYDPTSREYRVCVQLRDGDDPAALGLEQGILPGGRYVRERLEGEPPGIYGSIKPSFERLAQRPDRDATRPEIEFYRRHDTIDLLLPVT
jgi:hypothetical protein